jgi:hypothetical protein
MTATPDEIRDQVLDDVFTGDAEIQIGDRRVRKMSPAERLAAIGEIDSSTRSPFIKVGMARRSI